MHVLWTKIELVMKRIRLVGYSEPAEGDFESTWFFFQFQAPAAAGI